MENKTKRLVKGSEEAKAYMADLRSKRGTKTQPIPIPQKEPTPTPIQTEEPISTPTPKRRTKNKINVEF